MRLVNKRLTAGQGRRLSAAELQIFKPYFAEIVLQKARIFEGTVPFWLKKNMCAVVLKHRIYLREGAYQADSFRGIELLGHELMHVSQFVHGMTYLRYIWSCRLGYQNSCYELEAYAKGKQIIADFRQVA